MRAGAAAESRPPSVIEVCNKFAETTARVQRIAAGPVAAAIRGGCNSALHSSLLMSSPKIRALAVQHREQIKLSFLRVVMLLDETFLFSRRKRRPNFPRR